MQASLATAGNVDGSPLSESASGRQKKPFAHRRDGLARLPVLAAAARALGSPMLTLCSCTRDPVDMWRSHPDNTVPAAWRDLRAAIDEALAATEPWGTVLGIEPERANVVSDARAAERLLGEVSAAVSCLRRIGLQE
jgi:sugar phosphate isomerase/epimerase